MPKETAQPIPLAPPDRQVSRELKPAYWIVPFEQPKLPSDRNRLYISRRTATVTVNAALENDQDLLDQYRYL